VAQRKALTEQQVALLRWVAAGCPHGEAEGSYRISAAALRRRGLLTISGRGPAWSAAITPKGREYLAKASSPEPPIRRQPKVPVTQQLVDDVVAAGGSLRVPRRRAGDPAYIDYRRRAGFAKRFAKVPNGKWLEVIEIGEELEIRLVDALETTGRVELDDVVVPTGIEHCHPVAERFRDDQGRHEVSRGQLQRAVRIVHAIAKEAERRGWSVEYSGPPGREDWRDSSVRDSGGRLALEVEGAHRFRLRLRERGVQARGSWEESVRVRRRPSLPARSMPREDAPSSPYDAEGTGVLALELEDERWFGLPGRQRRWGDRASWRLEERLSHLFREIQERVAETKRVAEEERVKAQREAEAASMVAEARERTWNELMEKARRALAERGRVTQLRAQTADWQESELIYRYCDAMEETHGGNAQVAEWIEWARGFAASIDPLREPPLAPDPPEETPDVLQEFMPDGWSAQGPEYREEDPRDYWGRGRHP
jgi:hypothetical protein